LREEQLAPEVDLGGFFEVFGVQVGTELGDTLLLCGGKWSARADIQKYGEKGEGRKIGRVNSPASCAAAIIFWYSFRCLSSSSLALGGK
jgi:hypothetical protein